nr:hypothetical protein [Legionella yabuuchiae]
MRTPPGFTQKYDFKYLVYYELIEDMLSAIAREKQLKGGSKKKKLALIEKVNPYWEDRYETLMSSFTTSKPLDCFVAALLATTFFKNRTVQRRFA